MHHLAVLKNRSAGSQCASVLFLLFAAAAGCGSSEAEIKPTGPQASITGKVTNDGANVTVGSSVTFFCKEKDATASGQIDSQGKYTLSSSVGSIGVPAGRYQVMIRGPELPPPVSSKDYQDIMSGKVKKPDPPKDIPAQFTSYDTSGISVEVKAGANNFDFDLAKLSK